MALNALNSSDATPLNQPSAHQLGGLQTQTRLKERLQPAGRTERQNASLSALYHVLVQCTRRLYFCSRAACDLCAFLRSRFKNDGSHHPFGSADHPGAADGRREVVGLPAGRREAGDEAAEAGETSV